jgi:ribosomal RNA-processing protein 36
MSSLKRKSLDDGIQRRVRARRESTEGLESTASAASANGAEIEETSDASRSEGEEVRVCPLDHQSESSLIILQSESSEPESPDGTASISFGALAKAQDNLTRPVKSTKLGTKTYKTGDDTWEDNEAVERKAGRKDHRDFSRSSKHAPTEISSKKAVSRKREVVPVAKREHRDPRFEPVVGNVDESKIRKAYAFLDEYRDNEMKELKSAINTTKDEDAREKLKRALASMESRKKAQMRKDKEKEILDHHRKEEKELVKQGKKPFYLKKSEQKKRVLLDQYGNLKGKKLDRVIERRRKKVEGKEKKKMPFSRRGASS